MLKRRSRWLAGAAGLFLVLSMSGVAMGVTPPDAVPDVDTTATFEDVDGNGIDDDCQAEAAVAAPDAVTAEQATRRYQRRRRHLDDRGRAQRPHRWQELQPRRLRQLDRPAQARLRDRADRGRADRKSPRTATSPSRRQTVVLVVTTPPDAEPDADAEPATSRPTRPTPIQPRRATTAAAAAQPGRQGRANAGPRRPPRPSDAGRQGGEQGRAHAAEGRSSRRARCRQGRQGPRTRATDPGSREQIEAASRERCRFFVSAVLPRRNLSVNGRLTLRSPGRRLRGSFRAPSG